MKHECQTCGRKVGLVRKHAWRWFKRYTFCSRACRSMWRGMRINGW